MSDLQLTKKQKKKLIFFLSLSFRIDASDDDMGGILKYVNDDWLHPNTKMEKNKCE